MPERRAFSERAQHLIPGGAHTYSRGDDVLPASAPEAFVRGKGARVWALDGREFVDWGMGINNVLIGHAEDRVDDAAIVAIRGGQAFTRPTPIEVDAAEAVVSTFPGMEMVKFAKNGSDPNSAAIRLARAITGRDLIAYDRRAPFLSIHDWFIGTTTLNAGVPAAVSRLSVPFEYNDRNSLEQLFAEHGPRLAALIMEVCRETRPVAGFLERIRTLCDQHGVLLIFDEVVTGFRYHRHGAQALFGVTPDLMAIGKGMANGYSLAALVGKREYMMRGGLEHSAERVFLLSTTNGPERSALAAALEVMAMYRDQDIVGRLHQVGARVRTGLTEASRAAGIAEYLYAAGDFDCRPVLTCLGPDGKPSAAYRTLFLQEMLRRGVFMPWICPSFRHGDAELTRTLEAFDATCAVYARAIEAGTVEGLLEGRPVKTVFRKYN